MPPESTSPASIVQTLAERDYPHDLLLLPLEPAVLFRINAENEYDRKIAGLWDVATSREGAGLEAARNPMSELETGTMSDQERLIWMKDTSHHLLRGYGRVMPSALTAEKDIIPGYGLAQSDWLNKQSTRYKTLSGRFPLTIPQGHNIWEINFYTFNDQFTQ